MPQKPKPESEKRRTFGVSFDAELAERLDVLQPKRGGRSQFICDTLEIGLERRFGPDWREMADRLRSIEEEKVPA